MMGNGGPVAPVESGARTDDLVRRLVRATLDWVWRYKESLGLFPVIILLAIVGTFVSPAFLTPTNLSNVFQQSAVLGFVTFAGAVIILAGKFDLSLEGTVNFAPMLGAWLLTVLPPGSGLGLNPVVAVFVTVGAGALIGLTNGVFVVFLGLNAFLVTLAMQILLRGLTYTLTSGLTIESPDPSFVWIGQADVAGVPVSIIATALLFFVGALFMRYHKYGRWILAVGGSHEAARAAGIRPGLVWIGTFVFGGILAAIAGLILSGRVDAVTVGQGSGITFDMFAAAAIGGISLNGGRGNLLGALLGVVLLGEIGNVMTLAQVPTQTIDAVRGVLILIALVINRFVTAESAQ